MRNKIVISVLITFVAFSFAYGQGGRTTGKLVVGATTISQGDIKLSETLTTREGKKLTPGLYRISVALTSRNEAQFVFSPFELDQPNQVKEGLTGNALNAKREAPLKFYVGASVTKNSFVKGIASNIEGTFTLQNVTPSETMLVFESKPFGATATLGRPVDSKSVDLSPSFVTFEERTSCGNNCTEGLIKVTIKNEGNLDAKGKWNVVLVEPRFFVGTISDVPPGSEVTVTSTNKLKTACCNPLLAEVEVRPDFYNNDASDSNDGNNLRKFTINLQP